MAFMRESRKWYQRGSSSTLTTLLFFFKLMRGREERTQSPAPPSGSAHGSRGPSSDYVVMYVCKGKLYTLRKIALCGNSVCSYHNELFFLWRMPCETLQYSIFCMLMMFVKLYYRTSDIYLISLVSLDPSGFHLQTK